MNFEMIAKLMGQNVLLQEIVISNIILPALDGVEIYSMKLEVDGAKISLNGVDIHVEFVDIFENNVIDVCIGGFLDVCYDNGVLVIEAMTTLDKTTSMILQYKKEIEGLSKSINEYIGSDCGFTLEELKEELIFNTEYLCLMEKLLERVK